MTMKSENTYMTIKSLDHSQKDLTNSKNYRSTSKATPTTKFTLQQETPNELICPQCDELFERPLFLPCSHTFCMDCTEDLLEAACAALQERNRFMCPACNSVIKCGPEGIDAIPRNINIEEAVQRFKKEGKSRHPPCERHLAFEMDKVMWCETCRKNICPLCAVDDLHQDHKITPMEVIKKFQTIRRRLKSTNRALAEKVETLSRSILTSQNALCEINDTAEDLKAKVDKECDAMIAQIEKRRQAMYLDVERALQEKKKRKESKIKPLHTQFKQAQELMYQIKEVLEIDGATEFIKKIEEIGLSLKVEAINKEIS